MPKIHGIQVNVIDKEHAPVMEYGGHSRGGHLGARRSRVSTFIEAKDGKRFLIKVTADNPFHFEETLDPLAELTAAMRNTKPEQKRKVRSDNTTHTEQIDDTSPTEERNLAVDKIETASIAPFDLMVSVFIDGRDRPESRQMMYLSPAHPRYSSSALFSGRWVASRESDGKVAHLDWVFSDRGIEHILGNLDVNQAADNIAFDADDADILAISEKLSGHTFEEAEQEPMKAGQIEVQLRRVVIPTNALPTKTKFKADHYASQKKDSLKLADDCTHTTSFLPKVESGAASKAETFTLRQVPWEYYKKNEKIWVSFIFNYTARHKLVRMNLSDADGQPILKERMQRAEVALGNTKETKRTASDLLEDDADGRETFPVGVKEMSSTGGPHSDSKHSKSEEDADHYTRRQTSIHKKARIEEETDKIT